MTEPRDHDALPEALQPFSRALAIHDALPDRFRPSDETPLQQCLAGSWPTLADLRALVEWGVANPSPQPNVACPCTTFEQDEDCPVGYPSMLCGVCKGTGNTTQEQVTALACEMIKIASDIGGPEDPFAAWESIDLIKSQHEQMRKALSDMLPPDLPWKRDADGVLIHHKVAAINAARAALATTEGKDNG